jgi:hypothetical protein
MVTVLISLPPTCWDPAADRFCAVGAMWRAAFELMGDLDIAIIERTAQQVIASNGRTDCLQTCKIWKVTPRS